VKLLDPNPVRPSRAAPVRVALVRQKYRVDGGGERFVSAFLALLQEQGHEVTLITRRWEGDSLPVLRCDPPHVGRVLRDWGFACSALRQVRQHRFDLVQSHERIPGCQVYRAGDGVHREWLRQRQRVLSGPARWWLHVSPYHRYVQRAEKALFEHPHLRLVICNSRMVMREILDDFSIDTDKLRLVYNGVDATKFHPQLRAQRPAVRTELGIPDAATVFAFVGSGFERKGLQRAVEALAEVPEAHLVVVGKDKALDHFRRRVQRRGLEARVHFVGVRNDVGPYYGAADALLLPTLYDPFPNVVLEAMAAGLPVITSTKCGGAELLQEGISGYVCDALDHDALVRAMRRLSDPPHAERLGAEARRAVEPLTFAAMYERLIDIYQEMLPERF
jgi:UDP-glucose:(heptosyl)LPS alpha-1,3-glucosyltransferase